MSLAFKVLLLYAYWLPCAYLQIPSIDSQLIKINQQLKVEPIKIVFESDNRDLFNIDVKIKRISEKIYGTEGYIFMHKHMAHERTLFETSVKYNPRSNDNFILSPFVVPPTNLLKFVNEIYRPYLMDFFSKCSNAPYLEEPITSYDIIPNNYTLEKCVFAADDLPDYAPLGYYGIFANIYRTDAHAFNSTSLVNFKIFKGND